MSCPSTRTSAAKETSNTGQTADLLDADMENDQNALPVEVPVQSSSERREVRHKYRELLLEITQKEEEDQQQISDLNEKLNEVDGLFPKVHMTREAALDSKLVNYITTQGIVKARQMSTSIINFHPAEFVEKLEPLLTCDQSEEDWSAFGKTVSVMFKRSPAFHFMRGTFITDNPPSQKTRTQRTKDNDTNNVRKEAPETVTGIQNREQEVTTEEVEMVLQLLRRYYQKVKGPICFMEFVVDPNSYTQTILNIFHLSFLIKDGYVNSYLDEFGLPVIVPVDENGSTSKRSRNEAVLSMDKQDWENIVREFDITKALISTNPSQSQQTSNRNPKSPKKKRTE